MPLAALPLLALLFVLLSTVTPQHTSAKPTDFGFIGTFDELTVAIHSDSSRAQLSKDERDAAGDDDSDVPNSWCGNSVIVWPGHCGNTYSLAGKASDSRSATRFLIPLLRAPPLA
ncbi:hypothetical protein IDSA_11225 [Pseudidiomarina salinarum]|uniref:Uncharacterized protein n=2 Tax=Pseudidiomarina salinarum TaxID=435908 RepID=A0A094IT43_9GAMM|nr:hypothetical protein IDSA_11225 [Pseudidiomarina salinarum]RUO70013.1 hypothetical protein CWI79_00650 [Pseudidiomarina salinarum]